jgi:hypothetical protein
MACYELSDEAISYLSTISQLEMKTIDDTVLMLISRYFNDIWEETLKMDILNDIGAI